MERSELAAGLDPELVDEGTAAVLEDGERVRLAAGAVEREHELPTKPFAQRVLGDELLESAAEPRVLAEGQAGLDSILLRHEALFLEPADGRLRERFVGEVGQRRTAPQCERLVEAVGCAPQAPAAQGLAARRL